MFKYDGDHNVEVMKALHETDPRKRYKATALDQANKELAEGQLVTRTVTDATIQWKKDFSLTGFQGKGIKLRFQLRESKLYSFSFNQI